MVHFDVLQATTLILLGLLFFEDLPWTLLGSCLASNVAYYFVLQTFPFIQLSSPAFIASLGNFISLSSIVLLGNKWIAKSGKIASISRDTIIFTLCGDQ